MSQVLRKHIAVPQDHGAWIFLLSPLAVGLVAGGSRPASIAVLVGCLSAFLLRQPLTIAVKAWARRRPASDLPAAAFWAALYCLPVIGSVAWLALNGMAALLLLAIPAAPVLAMYWWLVSRRQERRNPGIEILLTGVLALAAPAAYWSGLGRYAAAGWLLWVLVWLQSAASIVYAYLRLSQREMMPSPTRNELWSRGRRSILYSSFNVAVAAFLALADPRLWLIAAPYVLQLLETVWGVFKPAIGWKATHVGLRQLLVSVAWTIIFAIAWPRLT